MVDKTHKSRKQTVITFLYIMFLVSIPAIIYLRFRFYFQNSITAENAPNLSKYLSSTVKTGPLQINLEGYTETGHYKNRPIKLTYKAYYDITGIVTSVRDYWGFGAYDTLVPRDVCLIWGKLADDYPSKNMSFHQGKRSCEYQVPSNYLDLTGGGAFGTTHYGSSLVSNNHLIPGSAEIRNTIFGFHVGDEVRIVGYLVRAEYDDIILDSSMSRTDVTFDHASTTCEIIYVVSVENRGKKK